MWMYHSHTDEVGDTYAGLMGPMVVTRPAAGAPRRKPQGRRPRGLRAVHGDEREQQPATCDGNIATFAGKPATVDPDDEDFEESQPDALDQRLRLRQPADDR